MANRRCPVNKGGWSNGAQDVVRESRRGQYQNVRDELPGGKPLHVHVCLDFTVELPTRSMVIVKSDYLLRWQTQAGPPAFQFDFRAEKPLAVPTDCAFHRPPHPHEMERTTKRRLARAVKRKRSRFMIPVKQPSTSLPCGSNPAAAEPRKSVCL